MYIGGGHFLDRHDMNAKTCSGAFRVANSTSPQRGGIHPPLLLVHCCPSNFTPVTVSFIIVASRSNQSVDSQLLYLTEQLSKVWQPSRRIPKTHTQVPRLLHYPLDVAAMVRKYKKVDRPHRPKTLHNDDSRKQAIELMHQGLNTKKIAEATGISERQIRHYRENLKDFGAILAPKRKDAGDHENILDFSQSKEGQLFKVGKRNKPLKPPTGEKPKPREISDAEREGDVHPLTRALVVQAHVEFGLPQPECVPRYGLRTQKAVQAIVNQAQKRAATNNRHLLHPLNFTDTPLVEESQIHAFQDPRHCSDDDDRPRLPQTLEFILCENGDVPEESPTPKYQN